MKLYKSILILMTAMLVLASCNKDHLPYGGKYRHVFIYYGAGYNNLSGNLIANIHEMEQGDIPTRNSNKAIVAFCHSTAKSGDYTTEHAPVLMQIYRVRHDIILDTIKVYPTSRISASAELLREVLTDVKGKYDSESYGFLFSSHGTGWIPKGYSVNNESMSLSPTPLSEGSRERLPHGVVERDCQQDPSYPETKSIGAQFYHSSSHAYEIDLKDFVNAFPMKMDYIILDACLCGGIEVAYQFRNVCSRIAFSPTEILTNGMCYTTITNRLVTPDTPDVEAACRDYFEFTNSRSGTYRSGTITLVDCSGLEPLAAFMKEWIAAHRSELAGISRASVQRYFYDNKHWFYDMRDILANAGATSAELAQFDILHENCVKYHAETPKFFDLSLDRCCGLSMYLPYSGWKDLNAYYKGLDWNKATDFVL